MAEASAFAPSTTKTRPFRIQPALDEVTQQRLDDAPVFGVAFPHAQHLLLARAIDASAITTVCSPRTASISTRGKWGSPSAGVS